MKEVKKNIGINVKLPSKQCNDKHCPFHNRLRTRGNLFTGKITKVSSAKTAQVEFSRLLFLPKYERYEKRKTRIHVHITPCVDIKIGDIVKIMECRPISKMKNFVVIENESS